MPLAHTLQDLPGLYEGQVLIWTTFLDETTELRLGYLEHLLSQDEAERASRFRFERDRERFIAYRGILREILGSYSKINPAEVHFSYGEHGKPYFNDPSGGLHRPISFNVSHSGDWAVYAFSTAEVGVDLEVIRPVPEMDAIVKRHFSLSERKAFASVAPALKLKAFYNCWTRKEAYVKAMGKGLLIPLDQFDVSLDPGLPARLISAQGISGDQLEWTLHSFDLSLDTTAALVCPRNCGPLLCGPWPGRIPLLSWAANSDQTN